PTPADVGITIEVADSSLLRDQRDKTRIYARWYSLLLDRQSRRSPDRRLYSAVRTNRHSGLLLVSDLSARQRCPSRARRSHDRHPPCSRIASLTGLSHITSLAASDAPPGRRAIRRLP